MALSIWLTWDMAGVIHMQLGLGDGVRVKSAAWLYVELDWRLFQATQYKQTPEYACSTYLHSLYLVETSLLGSFFG